MNVVLVVQVVDLITDIHRSLADCVFCISAQTGLCRSDMLLLLGHLSEEKSLGSDGAMTDVAVVLTMAALYAVDVRILDQEDAVGMLLVLSVELVCLYGTVCEHFRTLRWTRSLEKLQSHALQTIVSNTS